MAKTILAKYINTLATGALALTMLISSCGTYLPPRQPAHAFAPSSMKMQAAARQPRLQAAARKSGRAWQDEIIYFIFADRFANGDPGNDFKVNREDPFAFHGGDIQGIINKLDYIKDLGATTIWMTPAVDNRDEIFWADGENGKKIGIWGYHGYWTKDFYKVEEHLGTMAKFKEMVQKAHTKGLKVVLDIVFNHLDYDHAMAKDRNNPKSQYYDWFHHNGKLTNYEDQWWVENGDLAELPDMATENPQVIKYMVDASKWWIQQTGIDGFRLDTVKHVNREFWQQYAREIHNFAGPDFLLLGEVYDGRTDFCANYMRDGLDSVFDFPLYYAIKDVFGQERSPRRFAELFAQDGKYPDANMLSPFIDNHDVARFVHDAGQNSRQKLMLAMAFLMTIRGMPMLYYGTEVALPGGPDPDNRKDMEWDRDPELKQYLKNLTRIRRNQQALRRGRQLEVWQDDQLYGYTRLTEVPQEEVITLINNSHQPQTRRVPMRAESALKNTQTPFVNLLNARDRVAIRQGHLEVTLPPKTAAIYAVAQP